MAIEYNFTLDMDRSKRDNNIAYARTGDVDSITINADLVLGGAAYTPTGTNAFFECITPNGHSIRAAAQKSGSSVSVDVPSAAFQAAGVINVAYFRFETGEADNPTYVESTEPFAIVVREGIGDSIDAGDYIEEWRQLADQLEAIVAEVEQKAEQAETAINEQKTEVDRLKAQAQTSIAQDAEDVSDAKDTAISNINGSQGAVDAAIEKLEQKTQEAVDAAQEALDGTLATDLQNAIDRTLKLDIADMVNIADNSSLSSLTNVGSYCCKTAATAATISDSPVDDGPFNMYVFSSATSGQVMQLAVPIDLNSKPTAEWHVRFGTSSAMDPWSVIGGGADIAAGLGIDVTGDAKKTVSLDTTAFYKHHEATDIIQGSTEVTGGGRFKRLTVYGSTRQNLWSNPSGTNSGITVTSNDDGSITVSGTSTGSVYLSSTASYILCPGTQYTLSVSPALVSGLRFQLLELNANSGRTYRSLQIDRTSLTFTALSDTVSCFMRVEVASSGTTVSGTYRVMLNEGSEAEPWCPPGLNGVDELSIVAGGELVTCETHDVSAKYAAAATLPEPANECLKPGTEYMLCIHVLSGTWYFNESFFSTSTSYYGEGVFTIPVTTKGELSNTTTCIKTGTADLCVIDYCYLSEGGVTTPIDLDGHTLNSLPDGTRDELSVDATGAVTLVQKVGIALYTDTSAIENGADYRVNTYCENDGGSDGDYDNSLCDKTPAGQTSAGKISSLMSTSPDTGISVYCTTTVVEDKLEFVRGLAPMKMLYSLATPQEIDLPDVYLSSLASPSYTVFASSNVPAEIEAEVVKVDYLAPSDVYTKEEVDQKINDAGMPGVVPVSQGGTGVTTAAAERNRLGLGNTTGALPVANGGTGVTTEDAVAQMVFTNAPEASPTQAGVVKTLSDQDFCEFMGIDYNPDDWS